MKERKDEPHIAIIESKAELLKELSRAWNIIDAQAQRIIALETELATRPLMEAHGIETRVV